MKNSDLNLLKGISSKFLNMMWQSPAHPFPAVPTVTSQLKIEYIVTRIIAYAT